MQKPACPHGHGADKMVMADAVGRDVFSLEQGAADCEMEPHPLFRGLSHAL